MSKQKDLGRLIFDLNPYTNREIPYGGGRKTGDMDPYCRDSSPPTAEPADTATKLDQIVVESDGPYRQDWTFKGEPQKIGMAYRIKYRYPVYKSDGTTLLYWLEDYLLIGFEGAMGG